MTRGGPDNASTLLLYYIYQVGFSFWDTGYAAALTVVLLVVLGARRVRPVPLPRPADALPMSARPSAIRPRAGARALETAAAWLLGAALGPAARLRGLDGVPPGRRSRRASSSARR